MSNDWDKRFKKDLDKAKDHEDSKCDAYVCKHGFTFIMSRDRRITKQWGKEILAKQRTQIFKEVREKVIGNEEVLCMSKRLRDIVGVVFDARNEFRKEQLKKLKELEKEGK